MTKNFTNIIFDLGSTLIYFDADWGEALSKAEKGLYRFLKQQNLDLDPSFLGSFHRRLMDYYHQRDLSCVEHTTYNLLQDVLDENGQTKLPEQLLRNALTAFYAETQKHWHEMPGTRNILKHLNGEGYSLAIVSNAADDADVQFLVDKVGIREHFDLIVTSAAVGIRKPSPDIFNVVLNYWNISAEQAVMVGDSLQADIQGANELGMTSIWFPRWAEPYENLERGSDPPQPDYTIQLLDDLWMILSEINN